MAGVVSGVIAQALTYTSHSPRFTFDPNVFGMSGSVSQHRPVNVFGRVAFELDFFGRAAINQPVGIPLT